MKKIGLSLVLTGALALMVGCGGSSEPTNGGDPKTGTGYYKDSAVAGVGYVCGSERGTTDTSGKFTFEKGKSCTFTLAGMTLRAVKASALHDSVEVVEDNATIYTLLQTLDNDGNASNGITILPKVVEQLKKVQVTLPTSPAEVANVHNDIKNVEGYHGKLKTKDEAKAHVVKTQTEVTKKLLAGKTWYIPVDETHQKEDGTTVINDHVEQLTFKDNGTIHSEWQQNGETKRWDNVTYQINGNQLHLGGTDGDGEALDQTLTFKSDENGVLIFDGKAILYKDKSAAQAWLDAHPSQGNTSQAGNSTDQSPKPVPAISNELKALLAGKTVYKPDIHDGHKSITTFIFNENMTKVTGKAGGNSDEFGITTTANRFTFDYEGKKRIYELEGSQADYLSFNYLEADSDRIKEHYRFYFDSSKAQAWLDAQPSQGNTTENDLKAEIQQLLDSHNQARHEVGINNDMQWNDTIAADAQLYANEMATKGIWGHDTIKNQNDGYGHGNYGENLYTSTENGTTLVQASKSWIDEKVYYTYGKVGDANTCESGQICGHYTQIIWKNTTFVGCAKSKYKVDMFIAGANFKGGDIIVCKYQTPGNIVTQTPY